MKNNNIRYNSDFQKITKALRKAGWGVEQNKTSHWSITPPDKSKSIITVPCTPSSRHALTVMRRRLKQAGFTERLQYEF